jgi:hypothetical protein
MKLSNFTLSLITACVLFIPHGLLSQNTNYITNRAPLIDVPFSPLPLGSVKAEGWLLKQLQLQNEGLTGFSEILYNGASDLGPGSDWLGGTGDSWERAPYYVKGLVPLAYTLGDASLITKSEKWINWSLNSQLSNGFFGPANNTDWWARMPMLYAIRDFYEATNDARVISFFTKYFQYQLANLDGRPLHTWAKTRAGDNIEIIFWLYNRTGDAFLLTLADKLKTQAFDWTDILTNNKFANFGTDFYPKHNVNVPQGMKMPAIYYQKSGDEADKNAFVNGREHLFCDHGQAMGMQSGNEMLGGKSAMTGLEMCSIVEQMQSCETVQMILGDVTIGDQLEKVAFNALPGGVTNDFKGLQYYLQANQVKSAHGNHGFGQQYDNGLMPGAFSGYGCCRFNLHMGWPYYVKNMWAATNDNGLAVMAYGPSNITAKVGNNVAVSVKEETNYPFGEILTFTLTTAQSVSFPLKFRIPTWCKSPVVKVNGAVQTNVVSGQFYSINRTWSNNDKIELGFPMEVVVNDELNKSVSVQRGPIVYSLKIDESWVERTDFGNGFKEFEVLPQSAWNYALVIDKANPANSFQVSKQSMPENPYVQVSTPVKLIVGAKKLSSWQYSFNGLVACDPPYGPVTSAAATQNVELVPFGAQNIRATCLPIIGTPSLETTRFKDDFSDGDQKGWINYSGSLIVENGEYVATNVEGRPGTKSVQSSTSFSDFTYDVKIQVGDTGDGGVIFRANRLSLGADDYSGYYVGINAANNQVVLGKANGNWSMLKTVTHSITPNNWYQLRVIAQGANIKVFIDDMDTPKFEHVDNSFATGAIGVRSYQALARWDNIDVASLLANGIATKKAMEGVSVYPNPAKNYLDIYFGESSNKTCYLNLFNTTGKLMLSTKKKEDVNKVQMKVGYLTPGVYVLKINDTSDSFETTLLVN